MTAQDIDKLKTELTRVYAALGYTVAALIALLFFMIGRWTA